MKLGKTLIQPVGKFKNPAVMKLELREYQQSIQVVCEISFFYEL